MKKELFLSGKTPERKLLQRRKLLPAKGLLHAVFWEVRMELSEALQYKTGLFMDALLLIGSFLAALFLGSGSSLSSFYQADGAQSEMLLLIGYLFWGNSCAALLPCLAGMYGMGLLAGAVGLHAKKTGSLIFLIQTALLFVTNTLTPFAAGPLFLIPFCPGIDIARSLYLYGSASAGAWAALLCVNFVWLLLGNAVFSLCLKRERKYGAWDTY